MPSWERKLKGTRRTKAIGQRLSATLARMRWTSQSMSRSQRQMAAAIPWTAAALLSDSLQTRAQTSIHSGWYPLVFITPLKVLPSPWAKFHATWK